MRRIFLGLSILMGASLALPASGSAESRDQYLSRLKEVCDVGCLQPREFIRAARKQGSKGGEMAVIMDVRMVRRGDGRFQLVSLNLERSALEDVQILGSAGIDTSGRNGVGGLPRGGRNGNDSPDAVLIELDEQALSDFINSPSVEAILGAKGAEDARIIVEGKPDRAKQRPTLAALNTSFLNRRIVVRGTPELRPVWVGGRLDHRRKQVTLVIDNIDDLVVLPSYDDKGNPVFDERQQELAKDYGK